MRLPADTLAVSDLLPGDSHQHTFRAMGTDGHLIVVGGRDGLVAMARDRIDDLEGRWSRFRPDSEVCRLNAADGEPTSVSADTLLLLERAQQAWSLTTGWFDPTVLPALRALGYDRSFDALPADGAPPSAGPPPAVPGLGGLEVDRTAGTVRLPSPARFDAGGIGKGLAADLVAAEVLAAGADGVLVNLGGDLRVAGASPDGEGWGIEVETGGPWSGQLALLAGAVATSTPRRRRWTRGGHPQHHLVDPRTGRSATGLADAITVVAGEAWRAEVLATAGLLAGPAARERMLRDGGASALLVFDERSIALAGMEAFLR